MIVCVIVCAPATLWGCEDATMLIPSCVINMCQNNHSPRICNGHPLTGIVTYSGNIVPRSKNIHLSLTATLREAA